MRPIPLAIRERIANDPYYQKCARKSAECSKDRITIEHAMIVSGRQIDDYWNLIPLCWYHHLGKGLNKEYNRYLALIRATDEDLERYPKTDFKQMKKYLVEKYGKK